MENPTVKRIKIEGVEQEIDIVRAYKLYQELNSLFGQYFYFSTHGDINQITGDNFDYYNYNMIEPIFDE